MCCDGKATNDGSDRLEEGGVSRPFDGSATGWLLSEAVRALNTTDAEGTAAYGRSVEVLRRCGKDLVEVVRGIFRQTRSGDSSLRWNLLYVVGDVGDESAADFLVGTALTALPDVREHLGCETDRDMEIHVATMAIHALGGVAQRHPNTAEAVLKVVSARPTKALLVEAVKVAVDLGLREKAQHILPREDHWIFDIRRAHTQELFANPEREDGKERGFTPPKSGALYTAPSVIASAERRK
jgi:hypothetical protein